ncbi:hypothetical protein O6P43_009683 [Quillaja saponaria]|uniref:Uncharacterized protein n=1 Tax=Quillaja saponaria TaxID=32244 RepID=A0AAD7PYU8_QUISA|nr:hypothetical protein O6P43_009683 [Quillaja saponaria]
MSPTCWPMEPLQPEGLRVVLGLEMFCRLDREEISSWDCNTGDDRNGFVSHGAGQKTGYFYLAAEDYIKVNGNMRESMADV